MKVTEIQKNYGNKKVLSGISFQIGKGECVCFVGANGCGKSTLFRILAGVEKQKSGSITIENMPIEKFGKKWMSKVGYVPQENMLLEELTVKDNLNLFLALGNQKEDVFYQKDLCERFAISGFENETVSRLSGGMKKRVSIVCALLHKPEILILDEPSAALDLGFKKELEMYIAHFKRQGGSVLISSHDQGEILASDTLYAIKNGVLIQIEKPYVLEDIVEKYIR